MLYSKLLKNWSVEIDWKLFLIWTFQGAPNTDCILQEKQAAKAESEEGEEDDEGAQQAQETLDLLNESKQENNGKTIRATYYSILNVSKLTLN